MTEEFKFSDPGEGLQEAEVLEVLVSDGDTVNDGDTVLTVETDKANTELPASFSGKIKQVKVAEGDVIEVGDVLMTYDAEGDSGEDTKESNDSETENNEEEKESREAEDSKKKKTEESKKAEDSDQAENSEETEGSDGDSEHKETGSQKSEKSPQSEASGSEEDSTKDKDRTKNTDSRREPVPAAPSTRRLAREKGVDLHNIEPSGKHGRATAEDVEAAASAAKGQKQSEKPGKGGQREGSALIPAQTRLPPLPDLSQWGEVAREPLRSIRRATAQNMALSWGQIPHVFHQDIADITELERFRRSHESAAEEQGGKLTLTVLVMKALVAALKQFPRFNASLDVENREIVYKRYFHMGLAVATDRGLLVPVIRNADQKSLLELSAESADIARRTRNGEVSREDMQGGSITLTNPGAMGGSALNPLINHPQVAILGMGQARLEPVVQGDLDDYEIKPRLRLPLVLGFDHRVNDGAEAAQFVSTLIRILADPESLLLNI